MNEAGPLSPEEIQEIASRTRSEEAQVAEAPSPAPVVEDEAPKPTGTESELKATDEEDYEPRLIIFREVPGYDPRTLVLSYGEDAIDLQFCGCVNKYKKRFVQFLNENPKFLEDAKNAAIELANQGYYKDVNIKDIVDYLKFNAKLDTKASEYLSTYPHDFDLDKLVRDYLERKLMMETPALFGFFELTPVKCRSNCGYGSGEPVVEEEDDSTSLAGF